MIFTKSTLIILINVCLNIAFKKAQTKSMGPTLKKLWFVLVKNKKKVVYGTVIKMKFF